MYIAIIYLLKYRAFVLYLRIWGGIKKKRKSYREKRKYQWVVHVIDYVYHLINNMSGTRYRFMHITQSITRAVLAIDWVRAVRDWRVIIRFSRFLFALLDFDSLLLAVVGSRSPLLIPVRCCWLPFAVVGSLSPPFAPLLPSRLCCAWVVAFWQIRCRCHCRRAVLLSLGTRR